MRLGTPRNPVLVLVLTLVTCHIYTLYFVYKVSKETARFLDDNEFSPALEVVLSVLTCGFWHFYWDFRMGKRMAVMCQRVGLPVTDNSLLYLLLDLIGLGHFAAVGIINPMIQQDLLNRIWQAARAGGSGSPDGGSGQQAYSSPTQTPGWDSANSASSNDQTSSEEGTWYSSGNKKPRQPRPPLKK